ncbi:Uncharacterized protein OBRU01_02893 [Operophtera brumata]|uniref:Uncharacterized protein n=1 Tax=Operophtera brumata TaxID=104452 RepID=A0A0L7LRX7_OPEBR|nr:Uncharacterized protein OBRU01_02893 [Operophtera brumata]
MHHLYPLAKGDPLCPLGFHPQVRWPTRCKRCFRDYKEHGGARRREDDFTASTPALSTSSHSSREWEGWSKLVIQHKPQFPGHPQERRLLLRRASSSWTSTPDLGASDGDNTTAVTVSLKLPKRRLTGPLPALDTGQNNVARPPSPSASSCPSGDSLDHCPP